MQEPPKKLTLFCDGAARGNPGPGAYGFAIFDQENPVAKSGCVLGDVTNNVAEYRAVIEGLKRCRELGASHTLVKSDSQLLVRQLRGEYKVKAPHLQALVREVREVEMAFERVEYEHIPREQNRLADKLANEALDGRLP